MALAFSISDVQRREPDEALRKWYAGYHHCNTDVAGIDPVNECMVANDDKLLAALKAEAAAQEDPTAKATVEEARACVERVPSLPTGPMSDVKERAMDSVKSCIDTKRTKLASASKSNQDEYAALEAKGSADAWLAFMEKHPEDKRMAKIAAAVVVLSQRASGAERTAIEEKLVALQPAAMADLPPERRVLVAGPKGLRAPDLKKMADANISSSVTIACIKASKEPYRNFDAEEIVLLKQMGLSDEVVAAMIEVTTKVDDRRRADDDRKALRDELDSLRKMLDEKKATGGAATGKTVQTKDGPMDELASCGKRLAAMKLCENIPFPASTVCKSTAESSFPCTKG